MKQRFGRVVDGAQVIFLNAFYHLGRIKKEHTVVFPEAGDIFKSTSKEMLKCSIIQQQGFLLGSSRLPGL